MSKQKLELTVKKIKDKQPYRSCGSFKHILELLVEWMNRKEIEWGKFAKENSINSTQTKKGGD